MKRKLIAIIISILLTTGAFPMETKSFAFSPATEPTDNENSMPLTQNLIEREIGGGQTHYYSVDLTSGQFLFLNVQQLGIDVIVGLVDPDGNKRIEINSPDLSYGNEPFYWIAEKNGNYKIIVKAAEASAKTAKYAIKIEDLRQSTPQDLPYLEGQEKLAEGEKLRSQGKKEALLSALETYKKSVEHWQAVGELERKGAALNLIALVSYYLGDTIKAIEYFNQAVLARSGGAKAQSVSNLGSMYIITGEKSKALDSFSQGLILSREVGDKITESNSLNGIGNLYYSFGDQQAALNYYSQALTLSRQIGDRTREASALHNIGTIFASVSDYEKAISYFNETLPIWEQTNDLYNKAYTLNYLGHAYRGLQRYDIALNYYNQVLEISSAKGQKRDEAITLITVGQTYYLLGNNDKALEHCNKGLSLSSSSADLTTQAFAYSVLGSVNSVIGNHEKALDYLNKSLELSKALFQQSLQADVYYRIAKAYNKVGDLTLAIENVKKAIEIIEAVRSSILNQELKTYYFASIHDYYDFYSDLLMKLHQQSPSAGYDTQAFYVHELSQARTLLEFIKEGQINIREGVDNHLVEKETELKRAINSKTELLVRALNRPNYNLEEKSKLERTIHQLDTELEEIQSKFRQLSPRYAAIKQPKPLTLQEVQKEVLDDDTLLLEYSLGKEASYLWVVSSSSVTTYQLPKQEDVEQAARENARYFLEHYQVENESPEQKKDRLKKEEHSLKFAKDFSQMILGPAASHLGKKKLLIVGDGILQYVPFASLPKPSTSKASKTSYPMVVDHEIVTMPSASTMAVLRKEFASRKVAPKSAMVLADPIFSVEDERLAVNGGKKDSSFANDADESTKISLTGKISDRSKLDRLVFSAQEAKSILEIFGDEKPKIALGLQADLPTATSQELGQYKIIHFATHGFINNLQPELSGLVLSLFDSNGKEKNGYLTANHIFNLKLNADLVVLSACQTGFGKQIRGEGILGLTRGFLYAGAERVMFTLWSVNDESTSLLMTKFYTALKKNKLSPSKALRQAQISMWKDKKWHAPYHWAAFQLQGEW